MRQDDAPQALARIREHNPFPGICGRVCPAPCEQACVFSDEGAEISIQALERYAADMGKPKATKTTKKPLGGRKVAVIGSGPAGLSAAYYLSQAQYAVTVFESMPDFGGMLRYGIPEFRLPTRIVDEYITELSNAGVHFLNHAILGRTFTLDELFAQHYAGVLLATGGGGPKSLGISGEDLAGVYYAQELLLLCQYKDKNITTKQEMFCWHGTQTVVIGKGHSALDIARLAVRVGQQVTLVFEGLEEQLGVDPWVMRLAQEEGVRFSMSTQALGIIPNDKGFAAGVRVMAMEEQEHEGTLEVKPIATAPSVLPADTVVIAAGQQPNRYAKAYLPQLRLHENGNIWCDQQTGLTSMDKVFALPCETGRAKNVLDAIALGKQAAQKLIAFLSL